MSTIHWGTTLEEPTIDDVYEILAHDERRAILAILTNGEGELGVRGLVAYDPDAGRVSITDVSVRANLVRRHAADVFREN